MDMNDKTIGKKDGPKKTLKAHLHPKCLKKRNKEKSYLFRNLFKSSNFNLKNKNRDAEVEKLRSKLKKLNAEKKEKEYSRKSSYKREPYAYDQVKPNEKYEKSNRYDRRDRYDDYDRGYGRYRNDRDYHRNRDYD